MKLPISKVPFDLEKIRSNLPKYTIENLCDLIVCDRYFGFDDAVQVMCMEELARRRESGDTFDFETYIDNALKELPVITVGPTNIREVLGMVLKTKSGK